MASADEYAAWIVKNADKKGTADFDTVVKAYQEAKAEEAQPRLPEASAADRAQALVAGGNRAAYATLPGLPMDFAANLIDLAKAGYGAVGRATGMLKPEEMPALTNREQVPLTGDWFADKARRLGIGVDAARPDDPASRLLYAGGQGAVSTLLGRPGSVGAAARTGAAGASSQLLAQGVQEAGGDPSAQILASFGPAAGTLGARYAQNQRVAGDRLRLINAERDAQIRQAQEAGYVFPPSQVDSRGAGLVSGTLERFGGKIATQQEASLKNQATTQDLVKRDFPGIPPNQPLTTATLEQIRGQAGQVYEAVKQSGSMLPDQIFAHDARQVFAPYERRLMEFPQSARNVEIEKLRSDVQGIANRPAVDPAALVEQVKQLRNDGFANIRNEDPGVKALGHTQVSAAHALEGFIDRHLTATGRGDLRSAFKDARETIAKTYSAQDAMNPVTGFVDANLLKKALERGDFLSGGMKTVAETASVVPQSMRDIKTGAAGVSKLDMSTALASLGMAGATGNPWLALGAATPMASIGARKALLSQPYQQSGMVRPNYDPNVFAKMFEATAPDMGGLFGGYAAGRRPSEASPSQTFLTGLLSGF